MKPEEKFDRIIKDAIKSELIEHPSPAFTDHVLEKLGFRKATSKNIAKPILSKWTKIAITVGYVSIIILLVVFNKGETTTSSKYLSWIPRFELPSLTSIVNFNTQFYTILLVLIGAGWLLIFIDGLLKKTMSR
jgi:hypothetical protein